MSLLKFLNCSFWYFHGCWNQPYDRYSCIRRTLKIGFVFLHFIICRYCIRSVLILNRSGPRKPFRKKIFSPKFGSNVTNFSMIKKDYWIQIFTEMAIVTEIQSKTVHIRNVNGFINKINFVLTSKMYCQNLLRIASRKKQQYEQMTEERMRGGKIVNINFIVYDILAFLNFKIISTLNIWLNWNVSPCVNCLCLSAQYRHFWRIHRVALNGS